MDGGFTSGNKIFGQTRKLVSWCFEPSKLQSKPEREGRRGMMIKEDR